MKKYIFILLIATSLAHSQNINGIYKSDFTSFINQNEPNKSFNKPLKNIISVDIYDYPSTNGSVSVTSQDSSESVTNKFVVKSDKKYHYEDGNTYLYYDGVISLMGIETKAQCTIAFDVNMETLIIVFEGNATQVWELKKL